MSTTERDYTRHDGEQQERSATDWARGLPSERPPRGFLDRRRWVETKWSF